LKRICVFCGSSPGAKTEYIEAATALGQAFVRHGVGLVYGGANVGAMGQIARTVLQAGGEVIGVIPRELLEKNVAYQDLPDLRVVNTMHQRKAQMSELSDGFIALPGGLGTIEEFFEVLAWNQLGLHSKPCGILNVNDYYSKVIEFLDHAVGQQFIEKTHREMIIIDVNAESLLQKFDNYKAPDVDKTAWILQMNSPPGFKREN